MSACGAVPFAEEKQADHPAEGTHESDVGKYQGEFGEVGREVAEVGVDGCLVEAESFGDASFPREAFAGGLAWGAKSYGEGDALADGWDLDVCYGEHFEGEEEQERGERAGESHAKFEGLSGFAFSPLDDDGDDSHGCDGDGDGDGLQRGRNE